MEQILKRNFDVFAWSAAEIPGIPSSVICHSLNANLVIQPVKQKKRKLGSKRITAIRQETAKLLKADFIQKVYYPDWLSNVLKTPKQGLPEGQFSTPINRPTCRRFNWPSCLELHGCFFKIQSNYHGSCRLGKHSLHY